MTEAAARQNTDGGLFFLVFLYT